MDLDPRSGTVGTIRFREEFDEYRGIIRELELLPYLWVNPPIIIVVWP